MIYYDQDLSYARGSILSFIYFGRFNPTILYEQYACLSTISNYYYTHHHTTMIVPQFKLKQDDRFLSIFIRLPYIKVSACEFYIQATTFKFYLKPYLLSLTFQQRLREVDQPAKAVYYHEKYILEVHLEKETAGEVFNNLDLIANVVGRKKEKKNNKVQIEVIGGTAVEGAEGEQIASKLQYSQYNYGFCQQYSNVFDNLEQEAIELFAFNPKDTALSQRLPLSRTIIRNQFDIDSYLFDKYDNEEEIISVLKDTSYAEYLHDLHEKEKGPQINSQQFRSKMKITKKELLISQESIPTIRKEILSLVFSYLYELVCMCGDFGPESARTINETSIMLSCSASLEGLSVREVLVDCYRRCMTYSLYKSLKVCGHVQQVLTKYLSRSYIRVILEDIHTLLEKSEPRYLLNKIFIDDYLLYVYSLSAEEAFGEFIAEIEKITINEDDLDLGIAQYQAGEDKVQTQAPQKQEKTTSNQRKLIEQIQNLNMLD